MAAARDMLRASVLAALLTAGTAQAREVMSWLLPDVPPASMPQNGQPTDGIADQIVLYIIKQWPQAEHRFIYANPKRTWLMIEKGEPACVVAALHTAERDPLAHFVDTNLVPPLQLVVRQPTLKQLPLNAHGEADLQKVLASPQLRGIIVERRSYGQMVDRLIAARPAGSRMETTSVGDFGRNVLKLVTHGRADYTLDYDYSLQYASRSEPEIGQLHTVPIAQNNKPMLAGIACPRNAWGLATARRIDRIVGTREGAAAMIRAQNSWHTLASQQRYAAQISEFQQQRSKPMR
ncbi:TIGR02285 family protein [Pseudoduganella sp. OTU4001]|uniref:TIGR02285 family protein n=1 Tax=Pseudoduganella sp. OTU4001 TaxID=3043854 RepID=UPI00313DA908